MSSRTKNLTTEERNGVLQELLTRTREGKQLKRGAVKDVADLFAVSRQAVYRIWTKAQNDFRTGKVCADVSSPKKGRSGRKRKDYAVEIASIRNVPFNKRGTLRSLACSIGVPRSTLHRKLKNEKEIRRISSSIRPFLTEENKLARLRFCLSHVRENGNFHDFFDTIHIDEKWFFMTKTQRKYYVLPQEEGPHRTCKSKRFITKVMFLAAVARPRWDHHRKNWFNGKLGIWPFVFQEEAKRNSKNRPKGTLVTKTVDVINTAESRRMLIEKVIPAIHQRFPRSNKVVYVQQDNAKPHCSFNDKDVVTAGCKNGWTIQLVNQPANSPDFNVLDLGFFNAIQSLQHQSAPETIDELIQAVEESFQKLEKEKLDNVFITMQKCFESAMMVGGGNDYKIPHIKKTALRREGKLQAPLRCSPEAINVAQAHLNA